MIIILMMMSQENWVRTLPKYLEKGSPDKSANRQAVKPPNRGLYMRYAPGKAKPCNAPYPT